MNKLLLVAFHFPPLSGGSGVHRATSWARYLPENGWSPYIVTVNSIAHERTDTRNRHAAPFGTHVTRAFALDAKRHLAVWGRYSRWYALPDRWANWALTAIPVGLAKLYREKIDLILVTYPIATAVLIGLALQRLTGKPLVVDFRDSMTEEAYPTHPQTRTVYRWIERSVIKNGAQFLFTAEAARQMYLSRYPGLHPTSCVVIQNGYDEADFSDITMSGRPRSLPLRDRIRLVHSGLLYPNERDPKAFFRALRRLKAQGSINAGNLAIELRAAGSEQYYSALLKEFEIDDLVRLLPALPHREALQDTAMADGLLLFQGASCNHQIPAKAYEYLRLGKPILAFTDVAGDTAKLLRESGGATISNLADEDSIVDALAAFLASVRNGIHPLPDPQRVRKFTRRSQTAELAHHLDNLLYSRVTSRQHGIQE